MTPTKKLSSRKANKTQIGFKRLFETDKNLKKRIRKNETVGISSRQIKDFIESFKQKLQIINTSIASNIENINRI